jgi:hypothetical protein
MGCRPCPSTPDNSFYKSYIVRHRKDENPGTITDKDHDCDKVREGYEDSEEWSSCMEPPQEIDIYPVSPTPSIGEEEEAADQAESGKTAQEVPTK